MTWFESHLNSGGGGEQYQEIVLVNTSSSTSRWANPLVFSSFVLSDYDYIKIEGIGIVDNSTFNIKTILDVDDMPITDASGDNVDITIGGTGFVGSVNDVLYIWTSTGQTLTVNKITGIKKV